MAGLQTASHRHPAMKDKQRKVNTTRRQGEASNDIQMNSGNRRAVCVPPFIKSAQISSTNGPGNAAVPHTLNVDERLRLARERREERERQLLSKELGWQAREERARRYYERQLEERRSRLLEQREREERRRHAVEEKRTQRLREEKERHENAVRRTLEKSQRAKQTLTQGSRGRKNTKNNAGPGRVPLSPWEKNLVNRLLAPTCSYLARSKSAGGQSREEAAAAPHKAQCHAGPSDHKTPSNPVCTRTQHHSGPADHRTPSASSRTVHRIINLAQTKAEKTQENERKLCNGGPPQTADANSRAGSSTNSANRPSAPSPKRPQNKYVTRRVTPKQLDLCVVPEEDCPEKDGPQEDGPDKDGPDSSSSLSPGNAESVTAPAVRSQEHVDKSASSDPYPLSPEPQRAAAVRTEGGQTPPAGGPSRPLAAGTTDPEEASRLLAERRRGVRLQRERQEEAQRRERQEEECLQRERQEGEQQRERREEDRLQRERQEEEQQRERQEEECQQREEAERRGRQDLERRRAEARARREAEAQRVTEERKRRREEEEQNQARAEIVRKATEEAAQLQREREEELARQQEKAEQLRTEREKVFQREEAERQARKKRLEEIMRRTRKSDPVDKKPPPIENVEAQPKENPERGQSGTIEEALKPCQLGPKPCPLGLPAVDDMVPVVAFKERKSLRTLTGLEEIQAHQRAEVI